MGAYACEFEFDGFAHAGGAVWESLDAAGCDGRLPEYGDSMEPGDGDDS